MSNLIKLGLAVILALAAGICNYVVLTQRTQPNSFVAAGRAIEAGEEFKLRKNDLIGMPVPGDYERLKKTFVPFRDEEKGVLDGLFATRDYAEGDLILRQDVNRVPPRILGPFTLLSVGDRLRMAGGSDYSEGRRAGDSVTVRVEVDENEEFNEHARWLLDVIAAQSSRSRDIDPKLRIVAVMLYPRQTAAEEISETEVGGEATDAPVIDDENSTEELDFNEENAEALSQLGPRHRALIVPLMNVESVPDVLVRGDQIGFILPR